VTANNLKSSSMTMTTKVPHRGRHSPHRLGFHIPHHLRRFVSQTPEDLCEHARWLYLETITSVAPAAINELRSNPALVYDAAQVQEWCERYGLVSTERFDNWPRAYARGSVRAWLVYSAASHVWSDRDDVVGEIVPPRGHRRHHSPRRTLSPAHLVWLARYQSGETFSGIARTPTRFVPTPAQTSKYQPWTWTQSGADVQTIRRACIAIAGLIRLKLRKCQRGRPTQTKT